MEMEMEMDLERVYEDALDALGDDASEQAIEAWMDERIDGLDAMYLGMID
jgi:hypothetical protein